MCRGIVLGKGGRCEGNGRFVLRHHSPQRKCQIHLPTVPPTRTQHQIAWSRRVSQTGHPAMEATLKVVCSQNKRVQLRWKYLSGSQAAQKSLLAVLHQSESESGGGSWLQGWEGETWAAAKKSQGNNPESSENRDMKIGGVQPHCVNVWVPPYLPLPPNSPGAGRVNLPIFITKHEGFTIPRHMTGSCTRGRGLQNLGLKKLPRGDNCPPG